VTGKNELSFQDYLRGLKMNRAFVKSISLSLALAAGFAAVSYAPAAEAAKKKVTITDRVEELTSKVNAGQKNNELTLKEADDMRDRLSKVTEHMNKAKDKNGGKLSYKDQNSAEKDLNKISVKLHAKELGKRTAKPNE
jgi:TolA-binding protein